MQTRPNHRNRPLRLAAATLLAAMWAAEARSATCAGGTGDDFAAAQAQFADAGCEGLSTSFYDPVCARISRELTRIETAAEPVQCPAEAAIETIELRVDSVIARGTPERIVLPTPPAAIEEAPARAIDPARPVRVVGPAFLPDPAEAIDWQSRARNPGR